MPDIHKTTITVTVLTDGPLAEGPGDGPTLSDINYLITEGEGMGAWSITAIERVSAEKVAAELLAVGNGLVAMSPDDRNALRPKKRGLTMASIIVHGNPIDGLQFIGPFPDGFDIDEKHTAGLDYWWIAELTSPDRSIDVFDLTDTEKFLLDREEIDDYDLWRDAAGTAWAFDNDTSTTIDLTNGIIPPTE